MSKLIFKCILFALSVFLVDKAFLFLRETAPTKMRDQRMVEVMEGEIHQEILIFGSSRGYEGVHSWILEDSLGMSTYNLSYGGSRIEWQAFVLEQLLKHHTPKLLIRIIDEPTEFVADETNTFRTDMLYPLVKYPVVLDTLIARGEKDWLLSKLFVTHQLSKSAYDPRPAPRRSAREIKYGAVTNPGFIKEKDKIISREPYRVSDEVPGKHEAFNRFERLAEANNVPVLYVMPPNYAPLDEDFERRIKEVIDPNKLFIPVLTTTSVPRDSLFRDPIHLNPIGAAWFTKEIAKWLETRIERR